MKEFHTKRIQYYLYTNGQYCFYEIESLGNLPTSRIEKLSSSMFLAIPDDFLMKMRHIRLRIDSGEGMHMYFTAASKIPFEIFEMLSDKLFEKVFICLETPKSEVYVACFRYKHK